MGYLQLNVLLAAYFRCAMARLAAFLRRFCALLSVSLGQAAMAQRITGIAAEGRSHQLYSSMRRTGIILGNGDEALERV